MKKYKERVFRLLDPDENELVDTSNLNEMNALDIAVLDVLHRMTLDMDSTSIRYTKPKKLLKKVREWLIVDHRIFPVHIKPIVDSIKKLCEKNYVFLEHYDYSSNNTYVDDDMYHNKYHEFGKVYYLTVFEYKPYICNKSTEDEFVPEEFTEKFGESLTKYGIETGLADNIIESYKTKGDILLEWRQIHEIEDDI